MATYQAHVRLLVDAKCAPEAFERLKNSLRDAEWALDFWVDGIVPLDDGCSERITEGTYRDGEAFLKDNDSETQAAPAPDSRVVWNDPDRGASTGVYTVARARIDREESVLLINEEGAAVEALISEVAE